eukprot:679477-Lingulodinium_polyedra.AAC.1
MASSAELQSKTAPAQLVEAITNIQTPTSVGQTLLSRAKEAAVAKAEEVKATAKVFEASMEAKQEAKEKTFPTLPGTALKKTIWTGADVSRYLQLLLAPASKKGALMRIDSKVFAQQFAAYLQLRWPDKPDMWKEA